VVDLPANKIDLFAADLSGVQRLVFSEQHASLGAERDPRKYGENIAGIERQLDLRLWLNLANFERPLRGQGQKACKLFDVLQGAKTSAQFRQLRRLR
jgi:hypothetical protein